MTRSIDLRDDWPSAEPIDVTTEADLQKTVEYRGVTYRPEVTAKLNVVLRAADGTLRAQLPYSADDAEQTLFSAWIDRECSLRRDLMKRAHVLEQAMAANRTWSRAEFVTSIVGHPLLGVPPRRLVWSSLDGRTMTLDEADRFVGIDGDPVDPGDYVRLAHPVIDDLAPWRRWLGNSSVLQPFDQIERAISDNDPLHYVGCVVMPDSLYDLPNRGWRWISSTKPHQNSFYRALSTGARVVLSIDPGMSTERAPAKQARQTLSDVRVDGPATLADLSPVARSELVRDLELLEVAKPRSVPIGTPRKRGVRLELVDDTGELRLSDDFAALTFREGLWYHLNDLLGLLFDEYEEEEIAVDVAATVVTELRAMLEGAGPITDDLRAEVLRAAAFVEQAAADGKSVWVCL